MEPFPKEFYCPITQELMKDPVIGPDGQTYERSAIISWVQKHGTSPITRLPMKIDQLFPNRALKNTIEDMLAGKEPMKVKAPEASQPLVIIKPEEIKLKMSAIEAETPNTGYLHVSIVPPDEGKRQPCAFVCCIDVSGSMDDLASLNNGSEAVNFSRLDLVKHSVKTIIHMLTESDYLVLITFNEVANVELQLTKMDQTGKDYAIHKLENLQAGGSTNIWDALRMSTNLSRLSPICNSVNSCILLFTDGEPNINPPKGIVPSLNNMLKDKERLFSIHTFGYGYELDSELLMGISHIGHGSYNYIPDTTMIGTVFVNFLSNCLATAIRNATLEVKAGGLTKLNLVGYEMWNDKLVVGSIEYGQPRDFIFKYDTSANGGDFSATTKFVYDGNTIEKKIYSIECEDKIYTNLALSRALHCELIRRALDQQIMGKDALKCLADLRTMLKGMPTKDHEHAKALLRDLESDKEMEGQVSKSFSKKEWFDKWGKHYVRSLIRAHQLQQCHNFKDPGVQIYGGKLFKELQDKTDEIFCTLPAPKQTAKVPKAVGVSYVPVAAPVNMSDYMDYSAGCFDGEGLVKLSNGSMKKIKDLKKGDELLNSDNQISKVVSLIEIALNSATPLVKLNNVLLTPWHPVRVFGQWEFPINLKSSEIYPNYKTIYNLVLDNYHIVTINGLDVITLGHGFKGNKVVEHEYFGTEKVIEDLKRFSGFEAGHVNIKNWKSDRNSETGLVQGIVMP